MFIGSTIIRSQDKRWHTDPVLWEKLKPLAREKRTKPTKAENLLWQQLRRHQLHGLSFRRQHGIGQFIVDFYCNKAKLVVEVDGPIHQYKEEEDKIRQEYLESLELKIIRYSNNNVMNNVTDVVKHIDSMLQL